MKSRRQFLSIMAAAGFGSLLPLPGAASLRRTLDYNDPEDALTAMVKMRGSLVAEDVPHWYYGTMYAVLPGKSPQPLVNFEGSEIDYYEKQPDGSYHAYGATVSFFRDRETGKRLETFTNPWTGERHAVRANSISMKAHYIYAVNGFKRSDDERPLPETPQIQNLLGWRESGDHVWLTMRRAYPAGTPAGEHQLVRGSLAELHDPDTNKVYTTAAPTFVSPYFSWLGMGDLGGHALWVGPAIKLDSVKQYPRELLDFLEQNFPHKLTARPAA
ncbi:MAG: DUF1838 family protein [Gammaproteobacteria bacterium]|nr:DUF1838 family protein [Gammaproteobacteria bacterium]